MLKRISLLLISGAFAVSAAAAAAQDGYMPPRSPDKTTQEQRSEEAFGPFRVERTVIDRRRHPIMHQPSILKDAKIVWSDKEDSVEIKVVDDGYAVRLRIRVGDRASGPKSKSCVFVGHLLTVQSNGSKTELWADVLPHIRSAMETCNTASQENGDPGWEVEPVLVEAQASTPLFADAAEHWFKVRRNLFGGKMRRCIEETQTGNFYPAPARRCVKWSTTAQDW